MNHLLLALVTAISIAGGVSEDAILRGADARIARYRMGEATLHLVASDGRPIPAGTRVTIEQTRHAFLFGANIFKLGRCRTPAGNAAYERYFADLLNFATLPFYWWEYEPEAGRPNDARTDRILSWCARHGIRAKGHPLAWNTAEPTWLPDDPRLAMEAQMERIAREVRRFRGRLNMWDVVNEATDYDRPTARAGGPTLTRAIASLGRGPYLRSAFRAARNANPAAVLIINDYRTDAAYATRVLDALVDATGQPLYDVIGIQAHQHGGAWAPERLWNIVERFARFGKPLHVTETTLLSGSTPWRPGERKSTPEGEQRQADEVVRFYTVLFSHPAVEAITWWDFTDQDAWQGAPAGLLRADMTPKPAYTALRHLIKEQWWTHEDAEIDRQGGTRFTGFFGSYAIRVDTGGQALGGTFSFDRTTTGPIEVRIR